MQYGSTISHGATTAQLNLLPTSRYIKDKYPKDDAKYVLSLFIILLNTHNNLWLRLCLMFKYWRVHANTQTQMCHLFRRLWSQWEASHVAVQSSLSSILHWSMAQTEKALPVCVCVRVFVNKGGKRVSGVHASNCGCFVVLCDCVCVCVGVYAGSVNKTLNTLMT